VPGPWLERLPHFRPDFTPSRGEELQSEYLLPRGRALEGITALRRLAPRFAPLLQVAEIRSIAADGLWLSSSYGTDTIGFHFTWVRDVAGVYAVLPLLEEALLPLGARPHWGKCFVATSAELEPLYPRLKDFRALRERLDPSGKFANAWLDRVIGAAG
jgi:xylitol oxidase